MRFTKIHVFLFLAALAVGSVLVYFSPIEHKTVFVYPTPSNVNKMQYKDAAGGCFGFKAKEVKCSDDAVSIPAQV